MNLCKIWQDDDREDWVGCNGCAQYFHVNLLPTKSRRPNIDRTLLFPAFFMSCDLVAKLPLTCVLSFRVERQAW